MDKNDKRKLISLAALLILLIATGTIGYIFLLGVGFVDAFYMTMITVSTVGFAEVGEMNDLSKLFTVFMIVAGIGTVGYAFTSLANLLMEGSIKEVWRKKKMKDKIDSMEDHYIICGSGQTGQSVIEQFLESSYPFVVIEYDEEKHQELIERGIPGVLGDATHEDTLQACHIEKAKGLIATLSTDSDNVFTVLTARQMNPSLYIVSRAIDKNSVDKLKKAGADNTVSPNEIGGRRMASLVTKPSVISFLDIITRAGDIVLDLESVVLCENSVLKGRSLSEAKIPEETGLIVMAIKKPGDEKLKLNPKSEEVLQSGDTIIVLGEEEQIKKLRKMACDDGMNDR